MTCDDFKTITCKRMVDTTRAERSAVKTHMEKCESCMEWFTNSIMEQNLTPQDILEAVSSGIQIMIQDSFDPEI
jgi:hypothetical protein